MRIGYAPGGCLRAWLMQLGYPMPALFETGLVTAAGYDTYSHRIVFPLEGNLYGRSISAVAPPHRFLPGSKGGWYDWKQVQPYPEVILVEGLFDYAVLWQAGFHYVTCSLGNHLNACQFQQLCDGTRTVYLTSDERRQDRSGIRGWFHGRVSLTLELDFCIEALKCAPTSCWIFSRTRPYGGQRGKRRRYQWLQVA